MSSNNLLAKIVLLGFASTILIACQSHGRNASPNYHINAMERKDAAPYCHAKKCGKHHQTHHEPKDWNKDK